MKFMMSYDSMSSEFPSLPEPTQPLSVVYTSTSKGPILSQDDALETPGWSAVKRTLDKQHVTI
jgi:hypothetical protein